jgi:hypothetical protein
MALGKTFRSPVDSMAHCLMVHVFTLWLQHKTPSLLVGTLNLQGDPQNTITRWPVSLNLPRIEPHLQPSQVMFTQTENEKILD